MNASDYKLFCAAEMVVLLLLLLDYYWSFWHSDLQRTILEVLDI